MRFHATLRMQQLISLIVLLPKFDGGTRPIALLGFFYVLLVRILKPYATRWDADRHGEWDVTVGGSAEHAGWWMSLKLSLRFDRVSRSIW